MEQMTGYCPIYEGFETGPAIIFLCDMGIPDGFMGGINGPDEDRVRYAGSVPELRCKRR